MQKSAYLGLTLLMSTLPSMAEVITPQQAIDRAFMADKGKLRTLTPNRHQDLRLVKTVEASSQPAVYLFSAEESSCFYVMPADDCISSTILGYGEAFVSDDNGLPPAFVDWIEDYADQIAWQREHQSDTKYLVKSVNRQPIAPLISTKWSQSAPYNAKCPMDGSSLSVTGCVATAMAQVMKYHNWPVRGTGSNTYTSNGKTLSLDFSTITFDWDNMLDKYDGTSDPAVNREAVAELMYACGVSVNMDYSSSASGAVTANVATALSTYFGYDKGAVFYNREFYGIAEWEDMVYGQLEKFGPVQYSGRNSEGGHSFVCDGYNSDGFFHINWGWGGLSDGYFKLTALDPDSQGIGGSSSGYNINQGMVANICKAGEGSGTLSPKFTCAGEFSVSPTKASLGSVVTVEGGFYNGAAGSMAIYVGLRITAPDGSETILTGTGATLSPNYGWNWFRVTLPKTLAEGTYQVEPVFRLTGGEWNKVPIKISYPQYVIMTVSVNTAEFTKADAPKLSVGDIDCKSPFYIGNEYLVSAPVINDGDSEFLGSICAFLMDQSTQEAVAFGDDIMLDLLPGEELDLDYNGSFTPVDGVTLTEGTYYFGFCNPTTGEVLSYTEIYLRDKPAITSLSATQINVSGAPNKVNRDKFEFSTDLTCTAGYFAGRLHSYIFHAEGGSSLKHFYSEQLFIEQSQITKAIFNASYPEGDFNKQYFVAIRNHDNTKWLVNGSLFKFDKNSGVESVETDKEVENIEIYNLSGINVTGEELLPGFYVVRTYYNDGSVENRRVAVK